MALGAIIGGIGQLGSSIFSGISQRNALQDQISARNSALRNFTRTQDRLLSGVDGEAVFGRRPEGIIYNPVDISQSQLDTIQGNIDAFPQIQDLTDITNLSIRDNDLARIEQLYPGFGGQLDQYSGVTNDLLYGRLPFDDVLDIASDRAELSAALGISGGDAPTTLRDLGLNRLQAMQTGGNMFQSILQTLNTNVSPIADQLRPQSMFLDPTTRLNADILQRRLVTESQQNAEYLAASPDPAAQGIFNARYFGALAAAGLG